MFRWVYGSFLKFNTKAKILVDYRPTTALLKCCPKTSKCLVRLQSRVESAWGCRVACRLQSQLTSLIIFCRYSYDTGWSNPPKMLTRLSGLSSTGSREHVNKNTSNWSCQQHAQTTRESENIGSNDWVNNYK